MTNELATTIPKKRNLLEGAIATKAPPLIVAGAEAATSPKPSSQSDDAFVLPPVKRRKRFHRRNSKTTSMTIKELIYKDPPAAEDKSASFAHLSSDNGHLSS